MSCIQVGMSFIITDKSIQNILDMAWKKCAFGHVQYKYDIAFLNSKTLVKNKT